MKNQPNKATVKDGLPTAEEVLKAKVPPALYKRGDCYVGHALDAMQSYSDQQNAELRERVKELEAAISKISTITVDDIVFKIAKEALKQEVNND